MPDFDPQKILFDWDTKERMIRACQNEPLAFQIRGSTTIAPVSVYQWLVSREGLRLAGQMSVEQALNFLHGDEKSDHQQRQK